MKRKKNFIWIAILLVGVVMVMYYVGKKHNDINQKTDKNYIKSELNKSELNKSKIENNNKNKKEKTETYTYTFTKEEKKSEADMQDDGPVIDVDFEEVKDDK